MNFNETQLDEILAPLIANTENAMDILALSDSGHMPTDKRKALKYALWEVLAHARLAKFVLDMNKQKQIAFAGA